MTATPTPIEALRALVVAMRDGGYAPSTDPPWHAACDNVGCVAARSLSVAYADALVLVEEHERKLVGDALAAWGSAVKWFVYGCVAPSGAVDCHAAYININEKDDVCSFCGRPVTERPRERARRRDP